jgi:hypothetical protein
VWPGTGPSVQLSPSPSPRRIEAIAAPRTACRSCCRRRHAGRRPSLSLSALSSSPRRNEEKTVGARPLVVMHVPRKSEFFNVDENKYSQHVDENASWMTTDLFNLFYERIYLIESRTQWLLNFWPARSCARRAHGQFFRLGCPQHNFWCRRY